VSFMVVPLAAFALISRGADRLVVQGDPGSCGWVQISWAEQRQNRARAT
jgi:hypothetical protein